MASGRDNFRFAKGKNVVYLVTKKLCSVTYAPVNDDYFLRTKINFEFALCFYVHRHAKKKKKTKRNETNIQPY